MLWKYSTMEEIEAKLKSIEEEIPKLLSRPDLGTCEMRLKSRRLQLQLNELICYIVDELEQQDWLASRLWYNWNIVSDFKSGPDRTRYILCRAKWLKILIDSKENTETAGVFHLSSSRDLGGNTPRVQVKDFKCYVGMSLLNIPPMFRNALLGLCGTYLISQMKNNTAPFENSQLKRTTNAPPQPRLLTFGEAFEEFFPEITQTTMLLLCIILTAVLIFRLHPGVQIILCMFLLIPAFFFCLLELVHKASKTGVVCGSIKVPLIWFTTLDAVAISFVFMLATLLLIYFGWMLSNGNPRVEDVDDASLDILSEDLQGDDHV